MINHSSNIASFKTLYLSKEQSRCPLIPDIIRFIKKLNLLNTTISHRFSKRVLINSRYNDIKNINAENFIEIIDYDPFRRILLIIGKEDACDEAPLHWYLHHAREDINIAVLIKDEKYVVMKYEKIPIVDNRYPIWTIEEMKEVFRALRKSKVIMIKNTALLVVGKSLKEVENLFLDYVRKNESRRKRYKSSMV